MIIKIKDSIKTKEIPKVLSELFKRYQLEDELTMDNTIVNLSFDKKSNKEMEDTIIEVRKTKSGFMFLNEDLEKKRLALEETLANWKKSKSFHPVYDKMLQNEEYETDYLCLLENGKKVYKARLLIKTQYGTYHIDSKGNLCDGSIKPSKIE